MDELALEAVIQAPFLFVPADEGDRFSKVDELAFPTDLALKGGSVDQEPEARTSGS